MSNVNVKPLNDKVIPFKGKKRGISLDDLARSKRWVAWRQEVRSGNPTKVPYDPNSRGLASIPTAPSTWGTRVKAELRWKQLRRRDDEVGGVGVVLGELNDGNCLMGIDLDGCHNPKTGNIKSWANAIIDRFKSYAEVSPSKKGAKIFFLVRPADIDAAMTLFGLNENGKPKTRKPFAAGEHNEIAIDRARYYAVTDEIIDVPKTMRVIEVDDIRWFVETAGPDYLKMHGVTGKDSPQDGGRDESGSGYGFQFMHKRKLAGDTYRAACRAILADGGKAGEWANRVDDRQLKRAWERSAKDTETRVLTTRSMAEVKPKKLKWLWWPFVPQGTVVAFYGESDIGKSTVIFDMAARITNGRMWPRFGNEDAERAPKGSVIILSKEDPAETIRRSRLEAADADLSRVHELGYRIADNNPDDFEPIEQLDGMVEEVEREIARLGDVKLIVIDPITDYTGRTDINQDNTVRAFLSPLTRLAAKYDLAIIYILHLNKKIDLAPRQRAMGAGGLVNVPRSAVLFAKSTDHDGHTIMTTEKSNLISKQEKQTVLFHMNTRSGCPVVQWERELQKVDIDEVLKPAGPSKQEKAVKLLRQLLANGPMLQTKLQARMDAQHISWATVRRVKERAGVVSEKRPRDGKFEWRLLSNEQHDPFA